MARIARANFFFEEKSYYFYYSELNMKAINICFLLLVFLGFLLSGSLEVFAQSGIGIPGTTSFVDTTTQQINNQQNTNPRIGGNQFNTLDGNNTLGLTYQMSGCGLNYVYASQRLTKRFTSGPGINQPAPFNITGLPCPSGMVCLRAYVYWGVEGGTGTGSVSVTNPVGTNQNFPAVRIGQGPTKCWGYGSSYAYRADVTSIINGNGAYIISGLPTSPPLSQHDTDGATLIIIYRDLGATYQGHIVMHDGLIHQNGGNRNYTINNINACGAATVSSAMCLFGDMQPNIAPNHFASMNGGANIAIPQNFWNTDVRNAPAQMPLVTAGQMNSAYTVSAPSDCYSWVLAMLYYQTTTCTTCTPQPTVANAGPDTSICNGTPVQLNATGGISYSWSPATGLSATNISNPFANPAVTTTYTVAVTVSPGCVEFDQVVVTVNGSPTVTIQGNNGPYCINNAPVTLIGSPSGGTFTGPGMTLNNFNPATAGMGTHNVIYSYVAPNSCSNTANTSIIVQPNIGANSIVANQTICYGSIPSILTGTAPNGGSGVYSYQWLSSPDNNFWIPIGGATSTDYNNAAPLIATAYFRRVVQSGVCTPDTSQGILIQVNPPISNNSITPAQTICDGSTPGLLSGSSPSGGAFTYTFTWESSPDGVTWAAAGGALADYQPSALSATTYYRRIVSSTLCGPDTTPALRIWVNPIPTVAATNDVICLGQNATIAGNPNLGGGTWAWSSGQTTQSITVSPSVTTTYTVTYTLNGCTGPSSDGVVTVNFSPVPNITPTGTTALCPGAVVTLVSDPSNVYLWSPGGSIQQSITVGTAGTYCVQVTDVNGCISSNCITVTSLPNPVLTTVETPVNCHGGNDGQATVNVVTGPPNYQYSWNTFPFQNTQTATGLTAGSWEVTVTDGNNCTSSQTVLVTQPLAPLSVTGSATDALCFNGNQGTATAQGHDGTPGYTYSWNSNPIQNTQTALNLPAGTYTVTVTDANNCTTQGSWVVGQPTQVVVNATTAPVTCFGASDGSAQAFAGGGTPGYTYSWSNGSQGISATGFTAGTHTVTATDVNGCTGSTPFVVNSPNPLSVQLSSTPVRCNGESNGSITATPIGGTPGYFYQWNNGDQTPSATNLPVGNGYSVTVTDANGCTTSGSGAVTEPAVLRLTITPKDPTCYVGGDGSATANPTGGNPPYDFRWNNTSPNQMTQTAVNLRAGQYLVTVNDSKGCVDTAWTALGQPARIPNPTPFPDTVCAGEQARLGAGAPNGLKIFWYKTEQGTDAFYEGKTYLTPPLNGTTLYFIQTQDDKGCTSPKVLIPAHVGNNPVAGFEADKFKGELPGAVFQFKDKSFSQAGIFSWAWEFGDGGISQQKNPVYEYGDVGRYNIKLTVVDSVGCRDEVVKDAYIEVFMNVMMSTPNAFTPNGDGVNDYFQLEHYNIKSWTVTVYDRWGNQVYTSTDLNFRWDGSLQGQAAPEGVYVYVCTGIAKDNTAVERSDSFVLIR